MEDRHRHPRQVRAVYDRIGAHFSRTRTHAWPDVRAFVDAAPAAGTALDVGCGNGRHAALLAGRARRVLCLDASRTLLGEARDRGDGDGFDAALVQGDAAALPLADRTVDLALYVATIHHLPDRTSRVASLDELARVLVEGGCALVSAWSTEHERFDRDDAGFDTTVDWTLPDGRTVPRFYHIYAPAEFREDLAASRLAVADTFVSAGNCYGVVRGPP